MQIHQLTATDLVPGANILPGLPDDGMFSSSLRLNFHAQAPVEQFVSSVPVVIEYETGMPLLILYPDLEQRIFYLDRLIQIEPNTPFSIAALSDSCTVSLHLPRKDALQTSSVLPALALQDTLSELKATRLLTFFYQECASNFYFRGEQHTAYELVYVDRGLLHNLVSGQDIVLKQKEFMLIDRQEWHTQYSDQPVSFLTISFLAQNNTLSAMSNKVFSPTGRETTLLCQMLQEDTQNMYSFDCLDSLLRLFLVELLRSVPNHPAASAARYPATSHTERAIVDQLIQIVSSTSGKPLSLPSLAASAHISVTYLHRLFQTHLGMSPGKYIQKIRIEECKLLLRSGTLSMGEIAKQLGFSSQQHFSRQFRSVTGMTPSEYTRSLR